MSEKARINSKNKGNEYERKIARTLTLWWGEEFHRVPQSGGLRWGDDSRVAGDIVCHKDSKWPFTTECKKREGWEFDQVLKGTGDVEKYWQQAVRDGERVSLRPLLVFSKNFAPNYAMVYAEDFEILFEKNCLECPMSFFLVHKKDQPDRVIFILDDMIKCVKKEHVLLAYGIITRSSIKA